MKSALLLAVLTLLPRATCADEYCPPINGHSRHNVGGGTSVQCVYDDQQKGLWDERKAKEDAAGGSSLNSAAQRDQTSESVKEQRRLEEKAKARDAAFSAGLADVKSSKMRAWAEPCQKRYDEAKAAGKLGDPDVKIALNQALAACFHPHVDEYKAMTGGAFITVLDLISNSDAGFTAEAYAFFRGNMGEADRLAKEKEARDHRKAVSSYQEGLDAASERACARAPLGRAPAPFRDCREEACPLMVAIPTGTFSMGGNAPHLQVRQVSLPEHPVAITKPFAMAVFKTRVKDYDACVHGGMFSKCRPPSEAQADGGRPVDYVSRDDAEDFARFVSKKAGKKYRLPTEAEWEWAARAGGGEEVPCLSKSDPKGPNAYGVAEMLGTSWEMTQDFWHPNFIGASSDQGPASPDRRPEDDRDDDNKRRPFFVKKGGRVTDAVPASEPACRVGFSTKADEERRFGNVSIRLVRDL